MISKDLGASSILGTATSLACVCSNIILTVSLLSCFQKHLVDGTDLNANGSAMGMPLIGLRVDLITDQ